MLSETGTRAIADFLRANGSLLGVNLGTVSECEILDSNLLGDDGVRVVAEGVAKSRSLRRLSLCFNQIAVLGAKILADTISAMRDRGRFLEELILRIPHGCYTEVEYNHLEDAGAEALVNAASAAGHGMLLDISITQHEGQVG